MKQKIVHSPNHQHNQHGANFKKSPFKFALYNSPKQPQTSVPLEEKPYVGAYRDFQNVKKLPQDASSLRQTMNCRQAPMISNRHTCYDCEEEEEKPNKLNNLLRQTVSFKSTRAWSEKFGSSDITNSNEITLKKEDIFHQYRPFRNENKFTESRSAANLFHGQKNIDEVQLLNQKIDRNKKLIEELRKGPSTSRQQDKNYLKNVNNFRKNPSYIELDSEKQIDEKGFLKKKKEESGQFMTPKLSKGTYDTRFNSSPLIDIDQIDLEEERKEVQKQTISSLKMISPLKKKSSLSSGEQFKIDQFEMGRKLGQGKFGCVNIVRHKKTQGLFALKKIPKAMIKSHMMVDQLALQIRLQSCLRHRNVLGMYGFFDDKTHLYIVLEYMDGGTLYQKLKKGKIQQKEAAGIIRQITQSIQYLHDLGIAHRDIKPQNIVISNNVYKLCDFGWAAMCNQRRKTYCGTFDYVAPQILEGVQYDMTVDLWCLGVMSFELLTGKAPFYHISRKQTMKKILNVETDHIEFPDTMSEIAKDFISKLVRKNPNQRIKASQALEHPFIKNATLDFD